MILKATILTVMHRIDIRGGSSEPKRGGWKERGEGEREEVKKGERTKGEEISFR